MIPYLPNHPLLDIAQLIIRNRVKAITRKTQENQVHPQYSQSINKKKKEDDINEVGLAYY